MTGVSTGQKADACVGPGPRARRASNHHPTMTQHPTHLGLAARPRAEGDGNSCPAKVRGMSWVHISTVSGGVLARRGLFTKGKARRRSSLLHDGPSTSSLTHPQGTQARRRSSLGGPPTPISSCWMSITSPGGGQSSCALAGAAVERRGRGAGCVGESITPVAWLAHLGGHVFVVGGVRRNLVRATVESTHTTRRLGASRWPRAVSFWRVRQCMCVHARAGPGGLDGRRDGCRVLSLT